MLIETERLIITEFTMDMAQVVQENSVDEDNKKYVPDEVWESVEEVEETLEFLIAQYGSFEGPLVYPIIVKENNDNILVLEFQHRNSKEYLRGFTELIRAARRKPEVPGLALQLLNTLWKFTMLRLNSTAHSESEPLSILYSNRTIY